MTMSTMTHFNDDDDDNDDDDNDEIFSSSDINGVNMRLRHKTGKVGAKDKEDEKRFEDTILALFPECNCSF